MPDSGIPQSPDVAAIVFAYNADSGLFSALSDSVHKLLSPRTYACQLCKLTYGSVKMRDDWKAFLQSVDYPVQFLHRDQMPAPPREQSVPLPAVFWRDAAGQLHLLINHDQIEACADLASLIQVMRKALAALGSDSPP